jgi:hypothetical protein
MWSQMYIYEAHTNFKVIKMVGEELTRWMNALLPKEEVKAKIKVDRITKAYKQLLSGYDENPSTILKAV